jgi:hypothetical protein
MLDNVFYHNIKELLWLPFLLNILKVVNVSGVGNLLPAVTISKTSTALEIGREERDRIDSTTATRTNFKV